MTRRWLLAVLLCGCTKGAPAGDHTDPGASSSAAGADASTALPVDAPSAAPPRNAIAALEARRSRVTRLAEPQLRGVAGLENHFDGGSPAGYDLQDAELNVGHRHALLVSEADKPTSQARPFLVVVDERGAAVWTRAHPIGGILPPVGPLAIAGGPRGRVALAACDPPTKAVALRLWDDDGSPFADFQVLDGVACDSVSVLFWPKHGWIVVAVAADSTRARFVTEDGSLGWGRGLELGVRSRPLALAPASLAADTDETFVLVQIAQPTAAPGTPFHALAFRYDTRGAPIWPAAIDLGEVGGAAFATGVRAVLGRISPAGVHVTVGNAFDVDLRPSGDVSRRGRAPR
jgi:hypothetical protein